MKLLRDFFNFPIMCLSWGYNQLKSATHIYHEIIRSGPFRNSLIVWLPFLFLPFFLTLIALAGHYIPISIFSMTLIPVFYTLLAKLFLWFRTLQFETSQNDIKFKIPKWWCISLYIFLFYIFLILLIGVFTSPDTDDQWEQICTNQYNDWHPLIHTWTIWLFSRIIKSYTFVVVAFIFLFSLVCGWMYRTMLLYKYKPQIVFGVIGCIVFLPFSTLLQRVLWKDTACAISMLALSVAMLNIWHTDGKWLSSWKNIAIFSSLVFYTSFARHNGILFTTPLLVFLPFAIKGKKKILLSIMILFVNFLLMFGYIGVKNILVKNQVIDDVPKWKRSSELIGIPMEIVANIFIYERDKTPEDVQKILLSIAPYEIWEKNCTVSFEKMKIPSWLAQWENGTMNSQKVWKLFFMTAPKDPHLAVSTFFKVTSFAWNPFLDEDNQNVCLLFITPGMMLLLLIICATYAFPFVKWKIVPFLIPFIAYSYGTALVSLGYHLRFFYCVLISAIPWIPVFLNTHLQRYKIGNISNNTKG